jgi:DNA-binding NtrC family response regulator
MTSTKILFIDDDKDSCDMWNHVFSSLGFEFRSFQNGVEALGATDAIHGSDILVSDFHLPDMDGVDLVLRVRTISPGLPALVFTASSEKRVADLVAGIGNCELLLKPTNIETVLNAVRRSVTRQPIALQ